MSKLTKAQVDLLARIENCYPPFGWPVKNCPMTGSKLLQLALVKRAESSSYGLPVYYITPAGRAALSSGKGSTALASSGGKEKKDE